MEEEQDQPKKTQNVCAFRRPTITPECEILYENGSSSSSLFGTCKKNPGHPTFIPVKEFNKEHLPPENQSEELLSYIRDKCDTVVRIVVKCTSPHRPDTYPGSEQPFPYSDLKGSKRIARTGTGTICLVGMRKKSGDCPCHECKKSGDPKSSYQEHSVITASHVIYDGIEAASAVFECFYDSQDRETVKYLYGINDHLYNFHAAGHDKSMVTCVTHDEDLWKRLVVLHDKNIHLNNISIPGSPWAYMISHPHGLSKKITVGKIIYFNNILNSEQMRPIDAAHEIKVMKCRLPKHSTASFIPESFLPSNLFTDNVPMVPGKEYPIPDGVNIFQPPDVEYFFQHRNYDDFWKKFIQGTKFTTATGEEIIFPEGTEFTWEYLDGFGIKQQDEYYLTYDIDTCPGCSGATVLEHSIPRTLPWIIHSGSHKDNINLSGISSPSA